MAILWSHVCGVSAKEDELHRKSTCELDLLRMSWRFYGASREHLLQNPDAVNKWGNLLSTTCTVNFRARNMPKFHSICSHHSTMKHLRRHQITVKPPKK